VRMHKTRTPADQMESLTGLLCQAETTRSLSYQGVAIEIGRPNPGWSRNSAPPPATSVTTLAEGQPDAPRLAAIR
jgi:hypothetical protein